MIRSFKTSNQRIISDLSGNWDFTLLSSINPNIKSFDDKMYVPSSIESNIKYNNYKGLMAYRKVLNIEKTSDIKLSFKGISHTGYIYIDKKLIKTHYNAYTGFSCILENMTKGEHELLVIVDNSFNEDSALHIPNDYYTYGGIVRPCFLEYIDKNYIDKIHFSPYLEEGNWYADIKVFINSLSEKNQKTKLKLYLDENMFTSDEIEIDLGSNIFEYTYKFENIKVWSENSPNLYFLKAEISGDDLIERVGFREIKTKGKKILLNNKEIYIKGFNRHEDYPKIGMAIPPSIMKSDLDLMIDMGANLVRTCHYPNDERFLDMCDELGILVWEENHARGLSLEQMQHKNFEKQCEDCIDEMVNSHFNHPSIIIWGILNECASHTKEGRKMYEKQFKQIKSIDTSRPLTFATCQHYKDISLDLVDIFSFNIYYGWYDDNDTYEKVEAELEKYLNWANESGAKEKPVLVSEFGAGAIYGNRNVSRAKWTEERQADILDYTLKAYTNNLSIKGVIIWQFADCKVTDDKWGLVRPGGYNNKGIVDTYRRPKKSYETVKQYYLSIKSPLD